MIRCILCITLVATLSTALQERNDFGTLLHRNLGLIYRHDTVKTPSVNIRDFDDEYAVLIPRGRNPGKATSKSTVRPGGSDLSSQTKSDPRTPRHGINTGLQPPRSPFEEAAHKGEVFRSSSIDTRKSEPASSRRVSSSSFGTAKSSLSAASSLESIESFKSASSLSSDKSGQSKTSDKSGQSKNPEKAGPSKNSGRAAKASNPTPDRPENSRKAMRRSKSIANRVLESSYNLARQGSGAAASGKATSARGKVPSNIAKGKSNLGPAPSSVETQESSTQPGPKSGQAGSSTSSKSYGTNKPSPQTLGRTESDARSAPPVSATQGRGELAGISRHGSNEILAPNAPPPPPPPRQKTAAAISGTSSQSRSTRPLQPPGFERPDSPASVGTAERPSRPRPPPRPVQPPGFERSGPGSSSSAGTSGPHSRPGTPAQAQTPTQQGFFPLAPLAVTRSGGSDEWPSLGAAVAHSAPAAPGSPGSPGSPATPVAPVRGPSPKRIDMPRTDSSQLSQPQARPQTPVQAPAQPGNPPVFLGESGSFVRKETPMSPGSAFAGMHPAPPSPEAPPARPNTFSDPVVSPPKLKNRRYGPVGSGSPKHPGA